MLPLFAPTGWDLLAVQVVCDGVEAVVSSPKIHDDPDHFLLFGVLFEVPIHDHITVGSSPAFSFCLPLGHGLFVHKTLVQGLPDGAFADIMVPS